jgi:hypothetical protein
VKIALLIIGLLMILVGALWTGQGFGLVPGTFMYNNPNWIYLGMLTMIIGIGILYVGNRRPR